MEREKKKEEKKKRVRGEYSIDNENLIILNTQWKDRSQTDCKEIRDLTIGTLVELYGKRDGDANPTIVSGWVIANDNNKISFINNDGLATTTLLHSATIIASKKFVVTPPPPPTEDPHLSASAQQSEEQQHPA